MSTGKPHVLNLVVLLALLLPGTAQPAATPLRQGRLSTPYAAEPSPALTGSFGQLPLYFVENQGQMDQHVAYYLQGRNSTVYFTSEGVTYAVSAPAPDESANHPDAAAHDDRHPRDGGRWAVKLEFVGANRNARPVAQEPAEAIFSFFKGQPDEWHTGLRTYRRLVYANLWPGVDLVYYGTANRLKYEFVVWPGADPAQIRLAYRGATDVRLNASGQLEVRTPLGGFTDDVPMAYQETSRGQRLPVALAYALDESSPTGGSAAYVFRVGDYDSTRPLVLDPVVLVNAGYIGGAGGDAGNDIAVDGAGNAYVAGWTTSDAMSFPVMAGPDLTYNGYPDAFVAKVNAAGTALIYAGYIGGSGVDTASGITVDDAGNAYVTGTTNSNQATFPAVLGPDLTFNGSDDAFVAKVNSAGTALVYAGYIGGQGVEFGYDIAVDSSGNAYAVGRTHSSETTFAVTGGPDLTYNGTGDAYVVKVNATGTSLIYGGYLGGSDDDRGLGIAVDSAGNAFVTGSTSSDQTSFPVVHGPDLTYNGAAHDAFVAKVTASGTALAYAGYIGGTSDEAGEAIAVDASGNAYVTGLTYSTETTFPVVGGPDLTHNGNPDAFVVKVDADGTGLVYAGYIGGAEPDVGDGIAVDAAGNVFVTGFTRSDEMTFPVVRGPDLIYNGSGDAFVAKVNVAGTALDYAGYIGGPLEDLGYGIAVDHAGYALVAGTASSDHATFPVTGGPDLTYNGGYSDAFVAKVVDFTPTTANVDAFVVAPPYTGAPPGGIGQISIRYGNQGTTTAIGVVLTATLASGLLFLADTSGVTPTVAGNVVTWSLPDLPMASNWQFTLWVTVPDAPIGTRYPVTLVIASAGPEDFVATNIATSEVMVAHQFFLPKINR